MAQWTFNVARVVGCRANVDPTRLTIEWGLAASDGVMLKETETIIVKSNGNSVV